MKFTAAAVLSALVCAEAALAAPSVDVEARRANMRAARRESRRLRRSGLYKGYDNRTEATVQSNWGGAILEGSDFTGVSATVNVPRGSGGSSSAASAWVGIDGAQCQTAILQTGFDWYGDGTYDAWYEWYPEYASNFNGITIRDGDSIQMSVTATSRNSGSATLTNLSTGQKVTEPFSNVRAGNLCQTDAEFIIEDFEECSGSNCQPVPFSSFSPAVKFTNAQAISNGRTVSLNGAEMTQVIVNNRDLTDCEVTGSSSMTCTSTG